MVLGKIRKHKRGVGILLLHIIYVYCIIISQHMTKFLRERCLGGGEGGIIDLFFLFPWSKENNWLPSAIIRIRFDAGVTIQPTLFFNPNLFREV